MHSSGQGTHYPPVADVCLGRHVGAGQQYGALAYRHAGPEDHAVADDLPHDIRPGWGNTGWDVVAWDGMGRGLRHEPSQAKPSQAEAGHEKRMFDILTHSRRCASRTRPNEAKRQGSGISGGGGGGWGDPEHEGCSRARPNKQHPRICYGMIAGHVGGVRWSGLLYLMAAEVGVLVDGAPCPDCHQIRVRYLQRRQTGRGAFSQGFPRLEGGVRGKGRWAWRDKTKTGLYPLLFGFPDYYVLVC